MYMICTKLWGVLCREESQHTHPSSWCCFPLSTLHQAGRPPLLLGIIWLEIELFILKRRKHFLPRIVSWICELTWNTSEINSLDGRHNCLELYLFPSSTSLSLNKPVSPSHGRPSDIGEDKAIALGHIVQAAVVVPNKFVVSQVVNAIYIGVR